MLHKGNLSNKGSFSFFASIVVFIPKMRKAIILVERKVWENKSNQKNSIERFSKKAKKKIWCFSIFFPKSWVIETISSIVLFFLRQSNCFRGFIQKLRIFSQESRKKTVVVILNCDLMSIKTPDGSFWKDYTAVKSDF